MKKIVNKILGAFKNMIRRIIVTLKRNPQYIALIALAVSFVYYSLNLTYISQTTALINAPFMGLACFATMLFSILSFLCMLNAFPRRKKPNIFMLTVLAVMSAIIIYFDFYYASLIEKSTIEITEQRYFVPIAAEVVSVHVVLMIVMLVLTALTPLFGKLIRKINTSVEIEDNGTIEAIDISDEE